MTARRAEFDIMRCAMCNRDKAWRDGFPDRIYAECWTCAWERHERDEHAPSRRELRKERRRLVKAYRDALRGMVPGQGEPPTQPPPRSSFAAASRLEKGQQ